MDNNYFLESIPNIETNVGLRLPQIEAYKAVYDHFIINGKSEHAIIVLPTGVGKTGLMGIVPFGVSLGRVLIVTPQLVIKDAVLDSLDPEHPRNFWIARKVFGRFDELPSVIEYHNKTNDWELNEANIVILNVHKLQERLERSLINRVDSNFFDLIIIDEAHHSTAPTWERAVEHFSNAKVVKVTGTPKRSDGELITGEYVYNYALSKAMANGYVKTLERVEYIPDDLFLTLDRNDETLYSIDQIREMGIKDEDWITRSVAYSQECSLKVVKKSIELINQKRSSGLPHKIIAVACSIFHAEQLVELYEQNGMRVSLVHSRLSAEDLKSRLFAIENHKVEVVLHVAKLGEGYDHKYLSVAAIFRPFRNSLPYEQFIGRVLRSIDQEEVKTPEDNIACVVHHKELGLEELWRYYQNEKDKSDIIQWIEKSENKIDRENVTERIIQKNTGHAFEEGEGEFVTQTFIDTELIKERERRQTEEAEKLKRLKEVLPNYPEDVLLQMVRRQEEGSTSEKILRPDKFIHRKKRNLDDRIKVEMVPELILKYNIEKEANTLVTSRLFKGKYSWMPGQLKDNAALLAAYLEFRVNEAVGVRQRATWGPEEYQTALTEVEELYRLVDKILESELRGE
jgi:superfamily II DNA or RNA helicase